MFVRGGVYKVVCEVMGSIVAKVFVSVFLFDYVLTGLINAVSADPDFSNAVTVPDGFVDAALTVPSPKNKTLYIKLRDDPATVNTAVLPVLTSQP